MGKKVLLLILSGLALFFISSGLSYLVSRWQQNLPKLKSTGLASATPAPYRKSKVDPSLPKTEACPLNGKLFTAVEKNDWETKRPLGVILENSPDARPHSGLSAADVVYEAIAEGGITRFLAIYYCEAALAGNLVLAPVRSARIYFVNLISEYDGLFAHVGGAGNCGDPNVDPRAKALCLIDTAGIKDLDQFALNFKTCHRVTNRLDEEVASEHTMACFLEELYAVAQKRGWTNVDKKGIAWNKNFRPWKFSDAAQKPSGSPAASISYYFWGQDRGVGSEFNQAFDVSWTYDPTTKSYARTNGGQAQIDLNTGEPLKYTTVITHFVKETATGDLEKHQLYDVIGKGRAMVFSRGAAVEATWSKASRTARTIYRDSQGKEIVFSPGPIWISLLPLGNQVSYR